MNNGTMAGDGGSTKSANFILVENPKVFLPILKERHPHSCFMHNQVIFSKTFKTSLRFHALSLSDPNVINSDSWLVADFSRADNGHDICISAPIPIFKGEKPIPPEIKECFSTAGFINWDDNALFVALEKPVANMIIDISVNLKGNVSHVYPDILYYMEKEDALNISINPGPGVEVSRLDQDKGTDFILSTWLYSKEGSKSAISTCIGAAASAGVFVDGKCASGVITVGDGLMHCLYSSTEYRKRGFAKLTMQFCYKELAKDGCYPASSVEVRNKRSIALHESLGAKPVSLVNYVEMRKLGGE